MFTCINKGISWCVWRKLNPKLKKVAKLAIFERKKKLPILCSIGSLALYMPKPDKNDAFKGLILGHKVLQKCSNFFQSNFGVGRRFDPHISLDSFLWRPGHQNSSLREAQPVYYFSMGHRMTNKMTVHPAKTQISLHIHLVWSESLLSAQWVAEDPSFLHADSKDSDQTGQMPRLIWVFSGRTVILLVLTWGGSYGFELRAGHI